MPSTKANAEALFEQYLEVCNKAMQAHKDDFPYNHIWEAAEAAQPGNGITLSIYDDEPKGTYRLKLHDKHIEATEPEQGEGVGWRLNTSYMRQVVENPDEYINKPSKLDWDWLKNRLNED